MAPYAKVAFISQRELLQTHVRKDASGIVDVWFEFTRAGSYTVSVDAAIRDAGRAVRMRCSATQRMRVRPADVSVPRSRIEVQPEVGAHRALHSS